MNPLAQSALMAIFRFFLGQLAAFLVTHGIWKTGEAAEYVSGAALALCTLAWIIWTKYKDRILLLIGLGMPQGSTVQDAQKVMDSPSVTNPTATLPNAATVPKISQAEVQAAVAGK